MTWKDAHLTDKGTAQALTAHKFWKEHTDIPRAQSYYSSPLDRCVATANLTFSDLVLPADRPFVPLIKEVRGPCIEKNAVRANRMNLIVEFTRVTRRSYVRLEIFQVPDTREMAKVSL